MSKSSKNKHERKSEPTNNNGTSGDNEQPKIGKKEYEAEIFKLQIELVKLQEWVMRGICRSC